MATLNGEPPATASAPSRAPFSLRMNRSTSASPQTRIMTPTLPPNYPRPSGGLLEQHVAVDGEVRQERHAGAAHDSGVAADRSLHHREGRQSLPIERLDLLPGRGDQAAPHGRGNRRVDDDGFAVENGNGRQRRDGEAARRLVDPLVERLTEY